MPFWGRLYWNLLYPFHRQIFWGMARSIARAAESSKSMTVRKSSSRQPGLAYNDPDP